MSINLSFILAFILAGCTTTTVVNVRPIQSRDSFTITFPRACYVPDESGQDRIVLQSSPIDQPPNAAAGDPLPPATDPPLWHVLVIELHWRTPSAGNRDSPVADNAVLHWWIYGKPQPDRTAMLEYSGTGAVSVSLGSNGSTVVIHNAELRLIERHGHLEDPLGEFFVNARFQAPIDPLHARQILDDLNKAIDEAISGPATSFSRF